MIGLGSAMRTRTWLTLSLAFVTLIALIGILGMGAASRSRAMQQEAATMHGTFQATQADLSSIPTDLHRSGLLVRDYLLDLSHITAPSYRERLVTTRSSIEQTIHRLEKRMQGEDLAALQKLRGEVDVYWDSLDPIFDWSPAQRTAFATGFLRNTVLPRRDAVLSMAKQVEALNEANLQREELRQAKAQADLNQFLRRITITSVALGFVVALISIVLLMRLEYQNQNQLRKIENTEQELRRLSRSLVNAQEEERRSLSRELHDEVGQMITAMGMELANLEALQTASGHRFRDRLESARRLNADTLRTVRNLAMGLRPSMLDQLGLTPAIDWQAREFSRRSGVPVEVEITGEMDGLPDAYRTCIYRIVQEALTNCARHAKAARIWLKLDGSAERVSLTVADDGVGFDLQNGQHKGLGLLNIEERARELKGTVTILTEKLQGTVLKVEVPIPRGVAA